MNQKTPFYTPDNDTAFHLCGKEVAIRYLYESKNERTSPECVRMCVVTDELWENLRSQIGQRNGFWPGKFVWLISVCWTKNYMTHQYASERVLLGLLLEKSSSCNRGNDKGVHLTKKSFNSNFMFDDFRTNLNAFWDAFWACWDERKSYRKVDISLVCRCHHLRCYCCPPPAHIRCSADALMAIKFSASPVHKLLDCISTLK